MSISAPDLIAILASICFLIIFLSLGVQALRLVHSSNDFLFSSRALGDILLSRTVAATATSLATIIFWFLLNAEVFGATFFVTLIFFLFGQLLFVSALSSIKYDFSTFQSIAAFVYTNSKSSTLFALVKTIVIIQILSVLVIELVIGSTLFQYFANFQNAWIWGFALVAGVSLLYVSLGGFVAVVESDNWQFFLLLFAIILLALLATFAAVYPSINSIDLHRVSDETNPGTWSLIKSAFDTSLQPSYLASAILSMLIANSTLPLCQLQSWQRVAAANDWAKIRKGMLSGLILVLVMWFLLIFIGLTLKVLGSPLSAPADLFDFVKGFGGIVAWLIFPLIFVGLVAALVSTTDSAAAALVLETRISSIGEDRPWWQQHLIYVFVCFVIYAIAGFAFYLFYHQVLEHLMQVLFTMFSQVNVLFPAISKCCLVYSRANGDEKTAADTFGPSVSFGALLAFLVVWGMSINGMINEAPIWTFLSAPVGVAIAEVFAGGAGTRLLIRSLWHMPVFISGRI